MNKKEQILQFLVGKPEGLRTMQLADKVDMPVEDAMSLLKDMVRTGTLISFEVDSPVGNGRKATAYALAQQARASTTATADQKSASDLAVGSLPGPVLASDLVPDPKDCSPGPVTVVSSPAPPVVVPTFLPSKAKAKAASRPGPARPKPAAAEPRQAPSVPEPVYRCALWSDGVLEVRRDGVTVAEMTQEDGESVAAFLGRLTREKAAA